jgi:hypothetical protein
MTISHKDILPGNMLLPKYLVGQGWLILNIEETTTSFSSIDVLVFGTGSPPYRWKKIVVNTDFEWYDAIPGS